MRTRRCLARCLARPRRRALRSRLRLRLRLRLANILPLGSHAEEKKVSDPLTEYKCVRVRAQQLTHLRLNWRANQAECDLQLVTHLLRHWHSAGSLRDVTFTCCYPVFTGNLYLCQGFCKRIVHCRGLCWVFDLIFCIMTSCSSLQCHCTRRGRI